MTPSFHYLNHAIPPEEWTDTQRAILTATETEIAVEQAFASDMPGEIGEYLAYLRARGWWVRIQSPFTAEPDCLWWAGLTPLGTTGWNGTPDFWVGDVSLRGALWRATLLALTAERGEEAGGS